MGFRSNPRFIILVVAAAVLLLLLSLSHTAAAQENEGGESRSFQDLGRRGMVVRNGGDAKSAGNGLKLESGLGIFDAFFASLSMILVSEFLLQPKNPYHLRFVLSLPLPLLSFF